MSRALAIALCAGLAAGCGGGAASESTTGTTGTTRLTAAPPSRPSTGISVVHQRRIDARLTEYALATTSAP